jgi:HEAT repeat protein
MPKLLKVQICFLFNMALCSCCNQNDVPALIEKLNSSKARDQSQAALDLASCGSKASKAVPKLAELLYDENVGVQSSASYALRKIDTPEARAIMERVEAGRRK